jgi:hypothetical protein
MRVSKLSLFRRSASSCWTRLDVPGAQTTGENNDVILHEARARAFAQCGGAPNLLGSIESVNILSSSILKASRMSGDDR